MSARTGGTVRIALRGAVAIVAFGHSEAALAAGTAYQVDTAEVSEPGNCKAESWVSQAGNGDRVHALTPTCVVDLGHAVEFSSQFNRTRADGEWGSAATPKLKTNLIPSAIGAFGVALSVQAGYDLIEKINTSYAVTVPATLRFSEVVRVNLNAGWMYDRLNRLSYATYGAGFDLRTPNNVWTLTVEAFGQAGSLAQDAPGSVTQPRFQAGIRWRPVDRFNFDVIYGRNLGGENANWITFATTVRFPAQR